MKPTRCKRPSRRDRVAIAIAALAVLPLLLLAVIDLARLASSGPVVLITGLLLAAGFFGVLLRIDVEALIGVLRGGQVGAPVIVFTLTSALMGETAGTLGFDEIAAQVLIVLLLALALDARYFRLRAGRDRLDVVGVLFTMLLLALGEYYALRGLLTKEPKSAEMIAGAIAAGFTAVAVTALSGGIEAVRPEGEER
jgi:hypothetical protein